MTGLELGLGSAASSFTASSSSANSTSSSSSSMTSEKNARTSSSSSDEMLTTPKVPDSASLLSPRVGLGDFPPHAPHSRGASSSSKLSSAAAGEMLTTPKPLDLWTPRGDGSSSSQVPSAAAAFSPEALRSGGSPTLVDSGPRVPPEDLPMGSEIGLRSPCDGILAKRRREYRNNKMADKSNSVNSDSNSCDTPNSSQVG